MSFSSDVKTELARVHVKNACCRWAELHAFAQFAGRADGEEALVLSTENGAVAKRVVAMLQGQYDIRAEVTVQEQKRLQKKDRYRIMLPQGSAVYVAEDLMQVVSGPAAAVFGHEGCMHAYLRGAFMAAGSVTNPQRAYHLDFSTPSEGLAIGLVKLLKSCKITAQRLHRKGDAVVYLKEAESIITALGVMGAHQAVLAMEDVRILKGIRNDVNRGVNCDAANMKKTSVAAASQISSIEKLERSGKLKNLPLAVRQVAELRMEYPEATLQELSELIPGITKSGINHRLRRLVQMAQEDTSIIMKEELQ